MTSAGRMYAGTLSAARDRPEPGAGLQCSCFLRLDTSEAEFELKSKLKVIEFADELAFFANVNEEKWVGPGNL